MIKLIARNKLSFISLLLLAFLICYVARINLVVPLFLISLCAYLKLRRLNRRDYRPLNITLLYLIIFVISHFMIKEGWPVYYIPFALVPMLATLLFNSLEISFVITMASAVSVAAIASDPLPVLIFFSIGGIFSSILVLDARRRTIIIRAGFIAGILMAVSLILAEQFRIILPERYILLVANGIISSIIVLGVLPVFEYLFRTITNISLLELADFNHPLLQRLVLEAPGTYHHSLVVGNISEAACNAVGANALLARIGAYYHDIGKIEKAEYFSENQDIRSSKHEALSPSMSKLIIMNHVKEGVELAKKYKLNARLIDFIEQHHGNSLVYYFYRRALEILEEDQKVQEEGFRYQGPKPSTKETAIVLLADSVEAATRALKEPTPSSIKEAVHKVINNKFIDGQLDECDLALKDLEKISAVFTRILSGIYHSRVSYPEEEKSEDRNKKLPEKDSPQSEKD